MRPRENRKGNKQGEAIMHRAGIVACLAILTAALFAVGPRPAMAQASTTDLTGHILDSKGQPVAGARVRVVSQATGRARETTTDKRGGYSFLGLEPGSYQFTVLANGFATLLNRSLTLTIAERTVYSPTLQTSAQARTETVTSQPSSIDMARSASLALVSGRQINDLPINRRDYLQFSLLTAEAKPDNTPLAGAIPTSGFNFSGQRARGNEVVVDGVDAIDESDGSIQSTPPLEAVREFQVEANNFMPEYGRAIGGAINVVTESGSNARHGDLFGFVRNSRFQARNPFSVQVDPTTGVATGIKQPYTRLQAGATLGGALRHNSTFYFLSIEALRSHPTGFSDIGTGHFGLSQQAVPCLTNTVLMTAAQASFFQSAMPAAGGCASPTGGLLTQAESLYGAASTTALFGNTAGGPTSFPLPVDCSGSGCTSANVVPLPQSYVGLSTLVGNYPTTEKTENGSMRLDRIWNQNQRTFLRFLVTPSYQSGIQANSQGQSFGENAGTRASVQHFEDMGGEVQHTIMLSNTLLDQARFEFIRRGYHYGISPLTAGGNVGVDIPGVAYFGREPFSTVDRIEKRYELADDATWLHGRHTMKFGVDANFVQLTGVKGRLFDLNYGGVYNFAPVDAASVPSSVLAQLGAETLPAFTATQAYGLGIPQTFQQGVGNSNLAFDEKMLGGFWQDSWQATPRLTVNYGVRYDVVLLPTFTPTTTVNQVPINLNAESALNVAEGLPTDYKNIAPRLGIAWDPTGNGNTVVRAGVGLYYGMPPLALIYDSSAADGALSTQLEFGSGTATGIAVSPTTALQALNASSLFQGVVGGIPTIPATGTEVCGTQMPATLGYLCTQQRFNPTLISLLMRDQNYLGSGYPMPYLPFTMPVAKNFVNMYSEQGNLTIEHEFASRLKVGASYSYVRGLHLYRSRNINQANAVLLTQNFANAVAAGIRGTAGGNPVGFAVPQTSPNSCISTSGTSSYEVIAPGEMAKGFITPNCTGTPFAYIGTPAVFNFFRPSGPNPSYGGANLAGYPGLETLAQEAGFPTGYGMPVAWGDVYQQESAGKSEYSGFTLTVSKQFSDRFDLLSSWTWSHALDNTTDLTTLLSPQNNNNPNLEWGNSSFDQRHRWVTSAIIESPYTGKQKSLWKRVIENSFVSPIIVYASGRPYTVRTGTDYNLNFNSYTDRPSVVAAGTAGSVGSPYIPNLAFALPTVCAAGIPASVEPYGCSGNLGRNTFVTPRYINVDLRIERRFRLTEKLSLDFTAEAFNLFNHFNVLAVNPICDPTAGGACSAGQPTAAFNPRQFQFGLVFNF
jgi:Carboxypeptidase regulatory-like domain